MKNAIRTISIGVVAFAVFTSSAFAATATTGAITTTATVDGALSMTVLMKKNDSAGATVTAMDFGKLVDIGTGTLRSSSTSTTGTGAVDMFITANSHGLPYTISQTGTSMSNGVTTLPTGACTFVPVYAAADNGGAAQPAGSALGTKGTWVSATAKNIYVSETGTAALRTIQAVYSITDDPAAGATTSVPLNQPGGVYTGTATITVTA